MILDQQNASQMSRFAQVYLDAGPHFCSASVFYASQKPFWMRRPVRILLKRNRKHAGYTFTRNQFITNELSFEPQEGFTAWS